MSTTAAAKGRVTGLVAGTDIDVPGFGRYDFEQEMIDAVEFALAADRPLLLRGEPGIGKSQLARAVAAHMEWACVPRVVDGHTEVRDLLYDVDLVQRLADAQLAAHSPEKARDLESIDNYARPGALWWGLNWSSAAARAGKRAPVWARAWMDRVPSRVVVLIDELDKAEPSVPNALLGPLNDRELMTPGGELVRAGGEPPLVVFTTNEDRLLSDAFVRRCIVLELRFPKDSADAEKRLRRLAKLHAPGLSAELVRGAIELLLAARAARGQDRGRPCYGEFVDLLVALAKHPAAQRRALMTRLAGFVLAKHES